MYRSIDELQTDLDLWVRDFNEQRPHQGRWCFGKTPMQTLLDAMPIAKGENDRSLITSDKQNPTAQPGTDCQIEFRLIRLITPTQSFPLCLGSFNLVAAR